MQYANFEILKFSRKQWTSARGSGNKPYKLLNLKAESKLAYLTVRPRSHV